MNGDVLRAEERLIQAALRSLMAERRLADEDGNVIVLKDASDALRMAARWLTAVDALLGSQLTVLGYVETPLINPETCGAGNCGTCDGAPCEHGCHTEAA